MPRYDYECGGCHYRFELRQSFHDDPVADCPVCGSRATRRFSLVPVIFKGSGWYVNDQGRRPGLTNGSSADDKSEGKSAAKKEGAETKVEAAPKAKKEPSAPDSTGP